MKTDMSSNIDSIRGRVETPVSMMNRTVTKKDAWDGSEIHFVRVVWSEVWETLTTENSQKGIVRRTFVHNFKGRDIGV